MSKSVENHDALVDTLANTNPRETIRPKSVTAHSAALTDPTFKALTTRASIAMAQADQALVNQPGLATLSDRLVLGSTIGEGGMAIVRSAAQTSLGREVAVKSLRPTTSHQAASGLLQEAWITGMLEHPNIVPIHDLVIDDEGRPMLVLKRIKGRPWSALLTSAAEIRSMSGVAALEWNLHQLVQVCHAVAFAHSRGIVHRDLKPANVMIGGFGEVNVLDWGIAVSLVDDGSGRLPLASQSHEIAGTLAYMAPEMLGDAIVTERTDVYLLGSILFEIMTGAPPHIDVSVTKMLANIALSEPQFPASAPAELVAICRRAMASDPADRFSGADPMRLALLGFLEHRGSAEIAREALGQLAALEAALRASDADRVAVYQRFGECRFGFDAALRAWPDNVAARAGRVRALVAMTEYELGHGDARAASVMLAELEPPPPELVAGLAELEREVAAKRRSVEVLEGLAADQDATIGSRARLMFLVLFGLMWAAFPITAGMFPAIEVNHRMSLIVSIIALGAIAAVAWLARRPMTRTALNRGVIATVFVSQVLHTIVEAAAWAMGLDMLTTHMVAIGLWAGACGIAAVFLDRALICPTLAFLVALAACVVSPAQRLWAISTSVGVLVTTVVYIWYLARNGRRSIAGIADLLRPREPSAEGPTN